MPTPFSSSLFFLECKGPMEMVSTNWGCRSDQTLPNCAQTTLERDPKLSLLKLSLEMPVGTLWLSASLFLVS